MALPVFISQGWVASWYCVLWYHSLHSSKTIWRPISTPRHLLSISYPGAWWLLTLVSVYQLSCLWNQSAEAPLAPEVPAWVSFQIVSSENVLFLTPSVYFFFFLAACEGSIYKPKHAIIPFLVIIKMHSVNAMFVSLKHGISVAINVCFLVMVCLRIVNMSLYIIE